MTPIEPTLYDGARAVTFGKNQPQYFALPAIIDADGTVTTEWEPTAEELDRLMCGGRVRLCVHTFGHPLQPVSLDVLPPECGADES